jgi:hypothetical protein
VAEAVDIQEKTQDQDIQEQLIVEVEVVEATNIMVAQVVQVW